MFHPLAKEHIKSIAGIQLKILTERLAQNNYNVSVSDACLERIADIGYDPVFGARPLRRAIQNYIENPLAQKVLNGEVEVEKPYVLELDADDKLEIKAKA